MAGGTAGRCVSWDDGMASGCCNAALVIHVQSELPPLPLARGHSQEAVHCEVAPGNEEFQSAVKRSVPLGWVFKAMPQHHPHVCVGLMRKALLEDEQVRSSRAVPFARADL